MAGGADLIPAEANGFASYFTHAVDAERVAVKVSGTVTPHALDSFFANAGTSAKQVYDATGTLVWAPHNLVLQSENFTASWTVSGTPIVTAHTIEDDSAGAGEYVVTPSIAGGIIGAAYTVSAWFLKDAITSRFPGLYIVSSTAHCVMLNTSTGAIADAVTALPGAASTVADAGTHWRVSVTFPAASSSMTVRLYPAFGTVMGVNSNAAVGTVTVDRVQVNRGAVPTAYLPTTTAARYGLAVDHDPATLAPRGLLVEQAATNLILNNTSMSTQNCAVTAAAYTLSFFGTGTVTLSGTSTAGPLVGTGANNRVSLTFTPTAGSLTLTVSGTVSRAQLELGSFATSPTETFASTVTRTADNVNFLLSTIPALGSEWSMYCRFSTPNVASTRGPVSLNDGTANERAQFVIVTGTLRLSVTDGGASQASIVGAAPVANTAMSAAARIKANDFAHSCNGAAVGTDVAGTLPTLTQVSFGSNSGAALDSFRIEQLVIVPRAWSNAELQGRSSPDITGTLAATETGADTAAIAGTLEPAGGGAGVSTYRSSFWTNSENAVTNHSVDIGTAAADRVVIVAVSAQNSPATEPAVTVNGVALTKVVGDITADANYIFAGVVASGSGSQTVSLNFPSNAYAFRAAYVWTLTGYGTTAVASRRGDGNLDVAQDDFWVGVTLQYGQTLPAFTNSDQDPTEHGETDGGFTSFAGGMVILADDATFNSQDNFGGGTPVYAIWEAAAGGLPDITGTLAAVETGSDLAALAAGVSVAAALVATETGSDLASITAANRVDASLTASEAGSDSASVVAANPVGASLAGVEAGSDLASVIATLRVAGTLTAQEAGSDSAAISAGVQAAISALLAAQEAGSDSASIAGYLEALSSVCGVDVWDGTTWLPNQPVKVWDGAVWMTKPVKVWNGSAWVCMAGGDPVFLILGDGTGGALGDGSGGALGTEF